MPSNWQPNLRLRFLREDHEIPDYIIQSTDRCSIGKGNATLNLEEYLSRAPLEHISRHHLTIECDAQGWYIVDHSRNGTWLDGTKIPHEQPFPITDASVIVLLDAHLSVQIQVQIDDTKPLTMGGQRSYNMCRSHQESLQYILQRIETLHCAYLAGPAGIGKELILDALLQPEIHKRLVNSATLLFCELDLYSLPDYEITDFYHLMFNNLIGTVGMLGTGYAPLATEVEGILNKLHTVQNVSAYCNYLRQALDRIGRSARRRVVFVIKHFDIVLRHLETTLLTDLRTLYRSHVWQPLFVLTTSDSLMQLTANTNPEIFQFVELLGAAHWVRPLPQDELYQYVKTILQELNLSDEECRILHQMSGGWASLVRAIALVLHAHRAAISLYAIKSLPDRLLEFEMITIACKLLWADLSDAEQKILAEIASGQSPSNPQARIRVQTKNLVTLSTKGALQIASQLFEQFIRISQPHDLVKVAECSPAFSIDSAKGVVLLNGKILRAGPDLSKLEFQLLDYLAKRPNEVCSIDDILDHVYDDKEAEMGGSTRVRRLIARLRTKIETDPRNPQLIEGLRGIGIRLNLSAPASS